METSIMQQIRELLAQGKSSAEVIALGYKPPTVYKVQRWLRRKGPVIGAGRAPSPRPERVLPVTGSRPEIQVITTPEGHHLIVWHPEPLVQCPGCGEPVGHWDVCPLCNRLVPGCRCPEDSPSKTEGYTFQQIGEGLTRR